MHACVCAYVHACVCAYVHACVCACVRVCMRACVRACVSMKDEYYNTEGMHDFEVTVVY